MSERHTLLGNRIELREQRQGLVERCEALRSRLRFLLPVHEDVLSLDTETIINSAVALHETREELYAIQRKIDILSRELGV